MVLFRFLELNVVLEDGIDEGGISTADLVLVSRRIYHPGYGNHG